MPKLYFKYGAMGSSKTAQALMCRFNYMQKGYRVALLKPSIDNRFEKDVPEVISRIGLSAPCEVFDHQLNFNDWFEQHKDDYNVVIVDECQFCTKEQINQLKSISNFIPVLCYGLLTNFKTELFEGSKRLVEIADSLMEIKSVCKCGAKATVNARLVNGQVVTVGKEIEIGAEEKYEGMCYSCFKDKLNEKKNS